MKFYYHVQILVVEYVRLLVWVSFIEEFNQCWHNQTVWYWYVWNTWQYFVWLHTFLPLYYRAFVSLGFFFVDGSFDHMNLRVFYKFLSTWDTKLHSIETINSQIFCRWYLFRFYFHLMVGFLLKFLPIGLKWPLTSFSCNSSYSFFRWFLFNFLYLLSFI